MALLKDFKNEFGVPINYWRISKVYNEKHGDLVKIIVELEGFYNLGTKQDGFPPMSKKTVNFEMNMSTVIPNINMIQAYYYKILETSDFIDAVPDELVE